MTMTADAAVLPGLSGMRWAHKYQILRPGIEALQERIISAIENTDVEGIILNRILLAQAYRDNGSAAKALNELVKAGRLAACVRHRLAQGIIHRERALVCHSLGMNQHVHQQLEMALSCLLNLKNMQRSAWPKSISQEREILELEYIITRQLAETLFGTDG